MYAEFTVTIKAVIEVRDKIHCNMKEIMKKLRYKINILSIYSWFMETVFKYHRKSLITEK